jgi:hypothetical protein
VTLWGVAFTTMFGLATGGCHHGGGGPGWDQPFPLGAVSDSFWETQQTNAEAADFIFFDHDFISDTPVLTPAAEEKLMQMALRLEHVPFPVVIEQSENRMRPELDSKRYRMVVEQLARLNVDPGVIEDRVVVAPAFAHGFTSMEGQRAYNTAIAGGYNDFGGGRRFGGTGGLYR